MRTLLLLRGAPGCGKSTWIEQNGLKPYAISADDIRMMCQSPALGITGQPEISQANDRIVWDYLMKILETRMQNGSFTVIDATNSKTVDMKKYKDLCDRYRYRIFCVDFTDVPIEVAKERNANRQPEYKRVPDEAIDNMYSRFHTQKIPAGIKAIKPDELDVVWTKPFDISNSSYERVHHIGDLHGCNTALQEFFNVNGGIKDSEFYIFLGDYLDRGIENAELLTFLLELSGRPNVVFLEGNHEKHLWAWANDEVSGSEEFETHTRTALERSGIDKKAVRQFYRRLAQCAYYKYGDRTVLVTHGGLSAVPENLTRDVSARQMINGVGSYDSYETVAESFAANTPDSYIQIFGHRNTRSLPTPLNDKCYNLEGKVEYGGSLRTLALYKNGKIEYMEIRNKTYRPPVEETQSMKSVSDAVIQMRNNKYINEKVFGNYSSFNFTRGAFYDKVWDEQTICARGLYIDVERQKVAARAYNKFFNVNEREDTKFAFLEHRMKFPVTAYVKENGFLGIVSYDEYTDDLFVTTKSDPAGNSAKWFREMLYEKVNADNREWMKRCAKQEDISFVFECVDMIHDPHIIEYPVSQIFLLDIVKNDLTGDRYPYEVVKSSAEYLGIPAKEKAFTLETWQDFYDWYYKVTADGYTYNDRYIEGFVIEDQCGFMVKLKLQYYNFWKFMRTVSHYAIKDGCINNTQKLTTPLANTYYDWVRKLHELPDRRSIPQDICTLRRRFYAETGFKQ